MSFVKWVFTIVSGVILFSACGYGMYLYLSENKRLCEEGLISKGWVYGGRSGLKSRYYYKYKFRADNMVFEGEQKRNAIFEFQIGDSVLVRYVESDPSINELIRK
jgi:hypothetical protein